MDKIVFEHSPKNIPLGENKVYLEMLMKDLAKGLAGSVFSSLTLIWKQKRSNFMVLDLLQPQQKPHSWKNLKIP